MNFKIVFETLLRYNLRSLMLYTILILLIIKYHKNYVIQNVHTFKFIFLRFKCKFYFQQLKISRGLKQFK